MRKKSVAATTTAIENGAPVRRFMRLAFVFLLHCAFLVAETAQAQQRTVVNPSFEANNPSGNPGFQFFANNVVPGWDSTNGTVELWDSGFNGVASFAGVVHAEINSTAVGALYQNVCFTNGEPLRWSFAHRARSGAANPQTAVYEIANSSGVLIQTLATQVTTLAQGWQVNSNNTGLVTYTGPTGLQRLQFRAVDPGSLGNFIDDIQIFLSPYVEFSATAVSQLENFAPSALPANIVISGAFPSATTLALTITGGTATLGTDYVTPTGTANFTITIPAGTYSNQAFASGILLRGDRVIEGNETITFSIAGGSGYSLASTSVCGAPPITSVTATIIDDDLNLITTKTADVSTAANGSNVTFTVQVRNTGPLTGTNISLTESLPAGMTLVSATPSAGGYVNPVWTIPSLASGATATLTVVAQVNAGTAGSSALINSVTAAQGSQGDTTTAGDDLTETITVPNAPAMTILKTATPTSYSTAGTALTFSIAVTNSGNIVYPSAPTITDPLVTSAGGSVTCPAGPVAIGATITCTANYLVTQADVNARRITNVASAAITLGGTAVNATDDVIVPGPASAPALTLDKTLVSGSPYSAVGQSVGYSYLVTNTGNITLTAPISVTDNKIASVNCPSLPSGGLAPNGTIICTGNYAVTQADLNAGSVTNTATATVTQQVIALNPGDPTSVVVNSPPDLVTANAAQTPSLSLDKRIKAGSATSFSSVGDTVTFEYVVRNTGNVTTTANVTIADDKIPGTLICAAAGLAPAATAICEQIWTADQATINAGSVTNTAIASMVFGGSPVSSAPDSVTVSGVRTPRLTVAKVPSITGLARAGDIITYTYTVANTGNVTLTAVTPVDQHSSAAGTVALAIGGDVLDTDSGPISGDSTDGGPNGIWDTLAPGDSVVFTSTYTVTPADIIAGIALTNTVTVTSQSPAGTTPPQATDNVSVGVDAPGLIVIKTADATGLSLPPRAGDTISYLISVQNTGNGTLSSVLLVDTLTDTSGSAQPLDAAPVLASGDDGDGLLQVNETWLYTAAVTLTQPMIDAGGLSNTATGNAQSLGGAAVSDVSDDDGLGLNDPTVTPLVRSAGIAVVKSATLIDGGDGRADVGDSISYSYVVSNTGNTTLFDIGLAETGFTGVGLLPVPLLISGSADLDGDADAPDLAVGASSTYRVSYLLAQADIDRGSVTNQATANAVDPAGTAVNDLSGSTAIDDTPTETLLAAAPGMLVLKTAGVTGLSTPPAVGDVLTYTITVDNTGNVTLSNLALVDTLTDANAGSQPLDATPVFASGDNGDGLLGVDETWRYTASVTLTQAMIDAGGLSNTVTVNAQSPSGGAISDRSDDDGTGTDDPTVTDLDRVAAMTVTKLASITANAAVGDVISYAYTVTNTGNVMLSAATLDDQHTSAAGTAALVIAGDTLATDADAVGDSTDAVANGVWDRLGPNDVVTFTASYTVTQADIDVGADLENTVTVTANGPTGTLVPDVSAGAVVSVLPANPAIRVVKSTVVDFGGDGFGNAGDTLTYSYVLTNPGNVTLFDVGLTETGFTGAGITPVPVLQSGGADLDGDADAIDLAPNATATFQAVYILLQADIDGGAVTNQATATGNDLQGNPVSDLSGATVGDDDPTVSVLVGVPAFDVVKSASGPVYLFPTVERATFTIDVTNTGNVTQTGIQVTDSLAAFIAPAVLLNTTYPVAITGTGFTTGTANAAYDGSTVTALLSGNPTLLVGQTGRITITLTYSTLAGGPSGQNIANVSSVQLPGPVPSNPATVAGGDSDSDGVPDSLEGCSPGDDRDGDGICDAQDYDPTGTFYCEEDGRILPGGDVAVTGPAGTQSGVGSSGGITIVRSGADGRFQFYVTTAGTYTLALTYPQGGVPSTTRPSSGTLDVTSLLPANPGSLGSGEAGSTGQLVDFSAGANTYYTTFVFEAGDPFLINNNIPLSACAIRQGVIATKVADRESAVLGETINFTISFNNTTSLLYADAALIDTLPEGLVYTPGSGSLNGVATEPTLDDTRLNFGPRDIAAGEQISIRLSARVTSAAGLGKLVNRAAMLDQFGTQISNTASATVLIKAEQVFSCSDVIGKVFVDRNGNGVQDPDAGRAALTQDEIFLNKYGKFSPPTLPPPTVEQGLPGVRLVTVNGLLISTDEFGRYHVPCAALPKNTGSNFTLKLDPRTLPLGYTVTTENPRTLRLTAGKVAKMNFGVSDTKVVNIDLTAAAFEKGSVLPSDALSKGLRTLVADIKTDPSSLRLTYALAQGETKETAVARLQAVEKVIRKAWRRVGQYELQIQKSVKPVQ